MARRAALAPATPDARLTDTVTVPSCPVTEYAAEAGALPSAITAAVAAATVPAAPAAPRLAVRARARSSIARTAGPRTSSSLHLWLTRRIGAVCQIRACRFAQ